jgi:uncharacterized protein YndB with AHSA1/START domain
MPVRIDPDGRRSVEAEVEVPGTPEDVWQAIATGPGVTSWFVPTSIEEREGGIIRANFGPGMDSESVITSWSPPHRLVAESEDLGPGSPKIATEWIVEAREGGTCIVRVVHSWFSSTDDWDNQFEGFRAGWDDFFVILRLYLTHFRGRSGSLLKAMGAGPEPAAVTWNAFTSALGIARSTAGQRLRTSIGAPTLGGIVELVGTPEYPQLLIRADEPAPGLAHLFALPMGGQVVLSVRLYLYGEQAPAVVARDEPFWQAWIDQRFAMTGTSPSA